MEARNEKMTNTKNMSIERDPEIAAVYQASTAVSLVSFTVIFVQSEDFLFYVGPWIFSLAHESHF